MEFKFADVGEGITEGEIVRWHVGEGDDVEENDTLVEVETDKAIVDIPSPCKGRIESIPVAAGETIEVGDVLAVIEPENETEESTTVVGEISSEAEVLDEDEVDEPGESSEILATPKTRNLARELGVDLSTVDGTGEDGRITKEDVRDAAEEGAKTEGPETDGPTEVVRLSGVRKTIAEETQKANEEIPQVTHMDEIDVTDLTRRIKQLRDGEEAPSYKLTLMPFLVSAVTDALKDHPHLNSTFSDDEIVLRKYYNIGVTVDTEDGLIVPVVEDADTLEVLELGGEINRLAERARERTLDLDELKGGTFTVTNIGFLGGTWSTPQVNHPQAAILAAGRAENRPVVHQGEVTPRRMLPVSLSFDHRILDGADAARFINTLKEQLTDPDSFSL